MQQQFIKLIEQHQSIIYKAINLYVQDVNDKAELFQEILYQAWISFSSFKEEAKFPTWLYRVALNTAIGFSKKQKKKKHFLNEQNTQYLYGLHDIADSEKIDILYQLIADLSPVDKALIMLYIDNHDYQEISAIMGISVSNVGVKINRIKHYLKREGKIHLNDLV